MMLVVDEPHMAVSISLTDLVHTFTCGCDRFVLVYNFQGGGHRVKTGGRTHYPVLAPHVDLFQIYEADANMTVAGQAPVRT
jgi:hypothetical protein